jgi:hypothetical protein
VAKLNQIIAAEKGVKARTLREVTDVYHALQKPALLSGISRVYQPGNEDGEHLPAESTRVQVSAETVLTDVAGALTKLFDVVATKDIANCEAKADVKVDGVTVLTDLPVSYLLFLEKQLVDVHTLLSKLPVLDAAEVWSRDESADCWRTEPVKTNRTRKVPKVLVKYEATKEHPAQTEVYHEDEIVGQWTTTKFSGAIQAARLKELTERLVKLQDAVKYAREEANGIDVVDQRVGDKVFGYLFG